jgi:hypothetical protein
MTRLVLLAFAAAAGACAPLAPPRLAHWTPDEIIVPASVEGRVIQVGDCLMIEREAGGRRQTLVWPSGASLSARAVLMTGDSGRIYRIRIGSRVHLEGEPLLTEHGHYLPQIHREAARCGAPAFLVRDRR